jgi:hypothetical protein
MMRIHLAIEGIEPDFESCREFAKTLAKRDNPETTLISWSNSLRNSRSPCCLGCQIGDEPGWEVYGRTHGGRLRISVNNDDYVFIFS